MIATRARAAAGVLALVLLLAAAPSVAGLQVHLRDLVFVEGGSVTIGDVALVSGGTAAERETLSRTALPSPVTRPTLLPVRWVRAALPSGAEPVAVSGRRVLVVPSAGLDGRGKLFLERLLRAIDLEEKNGDGRIEVAILSMNGFDPSAVGPDLKFMPVQIARVSGYPAGAGSLSFSSGGDEGTARVWLYTYLPAGSLPSDLTSVAEVDLSTLAAAAPSAVTTSAGTAARAGQVAVAVRAGDPVTVVFRRGEITVATAGRAQASGGLSDAVGVRVGDVNRLYRGVVTGPAEVRVDVP